MICSRMKPAISVVAVSYNNNLLCYENPVLDVVVTTALYKEANCYIVSLFMLQIQFVNANDLCPKYFSASQLPHSLGGSYVPGMATQSGSPNTKPPPSSSRQHHNADGVNLLVKAFERGQLTTNTSSTTSSGGSGPGPVRPQPPSSHLKPKPTPPARTKGTPVRPPIHRPREGSGSDSAPSPAALKKQSANSDMSRNEHSKPRVPLLPRGSTPNKSSVTSPSQQAKALLSTSSSSSGKTGSPTRPGVVKGHSVGGMGAGGGAILSRIKNFEKKSHNEEKHGSTKDDASSHSDERIRSASSGSQAGGPLLQSEKGSPNKMIKRPLIPVKLLSADSMDSHREKRSKDNGSGGGDSGHSSRHVDVATATRVDKVLSRVPPPQSHAQPVHNVSPYASSTITMTTTNQSCSYDDGGEYENVDFKPESPTGRGQQQAPPMQTNYENIVIKPQQRPRPTPPQQPISAPSDSYENVEFSPLPPQTSKRSKDSTQSPCPPSDEHVSDDDDVLFGKEGPPGMNRGEVIYENFGPDAGNKHMSISELEKHILKHDKKGLSAEYLKIKNEPLCGSYKASRSVCLGMGKRGLHSACWNIPTGSIVRVERSIIISMEEIKSLTKVGIRLARM